MSNDGNDLEDRIQSERALAAHRLLLAELPKLGLTPSRNSGHVKAVRLHDIQNRYVFSWIPNAAHLLFYVRKPALNTSPHLRVSAGKGLPNVRTNPAGEVTSRLEGDEDARTVLIWLKSVLPLP